MSDRIGSKRDRRRAAACVTLASIATVVACSSSNSPSHVASSVSDGGGSSPPQGSPDGATDGSTSLSSCAQPCNAASSCLALSSNTSRSVLDFRVRTLQIATPPTLQLSIVQQGLIDMGIALSNACCEQGDGGFNILLRLDTRANTITAGGAPPSADPINAGYCFLTTMANGTSVAPVTAPASKAADGTWSTLQFSDTFEIPIFAHGDVGNLVVLPLSAARIENLAISPDGNCAGTYAAGTDGAVGWNPVALLTGYITLEDADRVLIPDLSFNSLCTLLEPSSSSQGRCTRGPDGKILAKGDFCSTTNMPATNACADSVRLSATFAASAVRVQSACGDGGITAVTDGATTPGPDAMP